MQNIFKDKLIQSVDSFTINQSGTDKAANVAAQKDFRTPKSNMISYFDTKDKEQSEAYNIIKQSYSLSDAKEVNYEAFLLEANAGQDDYVQPQLPDGVYYDFQFEATPPAQQEEREDYGTYENVINLGEHNVYAQYNYYHPDYEQILTNYPENTLLDPNWKINFNVSTLNGMLSSLKKSIEGMQFSIKNSFDNYVSGVKDVPPNQLQNAYDEVLGRNSIYDLKKDIAEITNIYSERSLYPMYVGIEISTQIYSIFSNIFRKYDILDQLAYDISMHDFGVQNIKYENDVRGGVRYFDFQAWLDSLWERRKTNKAAAYSQRLFQRKFEEALRVNTRTPLELAYQYNAYSEIVVYRVDKVETSTGNILKSIFFKVGEERVIFDYLDTQVKYGKQYQYKIFGYTLVVGTRWRISDTYSNNQNIGLGIFFEPAVRIVEVPLYHKDVVVEDNPPMPPMMVIRHFLDARDNVRVYLEAGTGENLEKRISLEQTVKPYSTFKDLVRFKSDDPVHKFILYRLDEKPLKWQDFKRAKKTFFDTKGLSTSAAHKDVIEPNHKYYYTSVGEDIHGNISNPSTIYEVEIIDDGIRPYSSIKEFRFDNLITKKRLEKSFNRMFLLKPALLQRVLNVEKTGADSVDSAKYLSEVYLGVREKTLWGKRICIAIRSKTSGRKKYIFVTFVHKHKGK